MSPRAACQLERLGFGQVYDYVLGIADWKAAGLPIEGEVSDTQLVSDATRPDIPTAQPDDLLGAVLDRATDTGWEEALVLDCDGIVIGRLRTQAWQQDRSLPVSQVMELGPTTVRPNGLLESLVKRMGKRGTELVTVTTPQGVLIGVLVHTEAQRILTGEAPEQIWIDCDGCPGRWKAR
jgi:predicted transcriptional regulator